MSPDVLLLPLTQSCCRGYNKKNPLLKDTLDMAYEVTKLLKKSPKREVEFHRKQAEFLRQMKHDFHIYDMDSPTL